MSHPSKSSRKRGIFSTRIGAIAATAGAAVGLGNIWRFPYEAGIHGGAAFIILYIAFIILLGIPVMCSEFIMGRASRSNEMGAFRHFSKRPGWKIPAYIGILASMMILSFYSVVAGWTVEYFVRSVTQSLCFDSQQQYSDAFQSHISSPVMPLFWTLIFLAANAYVLLRGVAKGIERLSNVMMPVLFFLLVVFCIHSLTMPGAAEGLLFLFRPDFSAITPQAVLAALGQAFFSLSVGLGCLMTYASYFTSDTRLGRTAAISAGADTLVALLAGVIIFPAVFTFGISPESGPTLVFEVLPSIFHRLPLGWLWSALFFFLLIIASITSTISMSEISISYLIEEKKVKRSTAVWLSTAVAAIFGSLCCLSFGPLRTLTAGGLTIFDLFNSISSDFLLPAGGMLICLFVGWVVPRSVIHRQMTGDGRYRFRALPLIIFCLRWLAPAGIFLILLNSVGIL